MRIISIIISVIILIIGLRSLISVIENIYLLNSPLIPQSIVKSITNTNIIYFLIAFLTFVFSILLNIKEKYRTNIILGLFFLVFILISAYFMILW
jgi:hypothetical protein